MSHDHGRTMRSGADKTPELPRQPDGSRALHPDTGGVPTPEQIADRVKEFKEGSAEEITAHFDKPQQHTHSMPIDMPDDPIRRMLTHPLWVPFSIWYSTRMVSQASPTNRARLAGTIEPLFDAFCHGHNCALDNE